MYINHVKAQCDQRNNIDMNYIINKVEKQHYEPLTGGCLYLLRLYLNEWSSWSMASAENKSNGR